MKQFYLAYSAESIWRQPVAKSGQEPLSGKPNLATSCGQIRREITRPTFCDNLSHKFRGAITARYVEQAHRPRRPSLLPPCHRPASAGAATSCSTRSRPAPTSARSRRRRRTTSPLALPEHFAEQADEMLKSRYNLEFLGIGRADQGARTGRPADRRACSSSSSNSATASASSAGNTGSPSGSKEYFVDLLFYHRFLKALVAFDLKIGSFEPEHAGKMDFYLNLLNEKERAPDDQPVHRHHPLRGEGRHRGRVRPQDQDQSHRRRRIPAPGQAARRVQGPPAHGQAACRRGARSPSAREIIMAKKSISKHRQDRRDPHARRGQAQEHPHRRIPVGDAEGGSRARCTMAYDRRNRDLDPAARLARQG